MIPNTKISVIAAIGENRELGKDNQLLWNIPGELKRFKEITTGHPIIMGRKTFESIGRVLPNRTNIIITRDSSFAVNGALVVHSLDEAIEKAKEVEESSIKNQVTSSSVILEGGKRPIGSHQEDSIASSAQQNLLQNDNNEIFIIGGGQIFQEALPITDRLYLTLVHKGFDADTFFPEYKELFTKEVSRQLMEGPEFTYTFLTLEK